MKVVIQQCDLDTCVTAFVLGVSPDASIGIVENGAPEHLLRDRSYLCIEAGGSGRVAQNNFDHHASGGPIEPACVQALCSRPALDKSLQRLVEYAAARDVGQPSHSSEGPRCDLSMLFSGVRLLIPDPSEQLRVGLRILCVIVDRELDPAGSLPELPEWRAYMAAKRTERQNVEELRPAVERFATRRGYLAGFLETDHIGALGLLYRMDCAVGIAYSPRYRSPAGGRFISKYTIGGSEGRRVDGLLGVLSSLEQGWGGPAHGTIIASPRSGTTLLASTVKSLVRDL